MTLHHSPQQSITICIDLHRHMKYRKFCARFSGRRKRLLLLSSAISLLLCWPAVGPQWRVNLRLHNRKSVQVSAAGVSALRSQRHCEQVVSVPEGRTVYSSTRAAGDGHTASNKHAFSANGQLVCSTWPVQRTAAVVRLSDGAQVLTLRGTGRNLVVSSSICWAPDNAQIAACCAPATVTHHDRQALICVWHVGHLEAAGASVCLAQLVNSDPGVRITADPMMHWSPDALHLAVLCPTDSVADQISIVAVSGMVVVCTLQAEIFALGPRFYMFEMGWSPDASALVVSFVHANALTNGGENGTAEDQKEFAGAIVSFVDAEVVM